MLPGFRFLLAAIVLSISILVFGLGAAALLRAAHEEFAQNPTWRAAPEPRFAQADESAKPVLAMLRVEPVATDAKTTDAAPAAACVTPSAAPMPAPTAPGEAKAPASRAETSPPIETAKAETSPADTPPSVDAAAPAPAAVPADKPAVADTRIAAVEQGAGATSEQPAPAEPVIAPTVAAPQSSPATTKIATLGGPLVVVETETKKDAVSEQDREEARKRLRAQRAKERRRLAARRERLARQLAAQQAAQLAALQAANDPFAQVMQQTPQPPLLQQTQVTLQTQATQQPVATRKTR
jgi:hypothetical protein